MLNQQPRKIRTKKSKNQIRNFKKRDHENSVKANFGASSVRRKVISGGGPPDELIETFTWSDLNHVPTTFAAGSSAAVQYYGGNTMDVIRTGGSQAVIPYWNLGVAKGYRKYRVLRSSIEVAFFNREDTIPLTCIVTPVLLDTAFTSTTAFTGLASLNYCKRVTITPSTGGPATAKLKSSFTGQRMFGDQYLTQDEYAGDCPISSSSFTTDPTTQWYWAVAVCGPSAMTETTGGASIQVTIRNVVKVYEVERDTTPLTFVRDPHHPTEVYTYKGLPITIRQVTDQATTVKEIRSLPAFDSTVLTEDEFMEIVSQFPKKLSIST